jgi:hypothetical protein
MSATSQQIIEEVYRQDLIADITLELQQAQRANDHLAFGIYRQVHAEAFKDHLERAKRKIDNILRRLP